MDATRQNWDGTSARPLAWSAWYPAEDDAASRHRSLRSLPESWFVINASLRNAPLKAAAPGSGARCPVVLLSHGTGGTALGLDWLAWRLARRGFIAVAVNHHGNTGTEPYRAEGFLCLWERARDLSAVLDAVTAQEGFADRLNLEAVFAAGFSAGAYTAMLLSGARTAFSQFEAARTDPAFSRGPREFPDLADHIPALLKSSPVFRASWDRMTDSCRDNRIKAALVCAPGRSVLGLEAASVAGIDIPVEIVVGAGDTIAPPAICASWLQQHLASTRLDMLPAPAGHYVFLPEATAAGRLAAPEVCLDGPGVDRQAIHDHVALSAVALFRSDSLRPAG
jgi:predicted dienelactone hydrolase